MKVPDRPLLAPWYRLVEDGDRLLLEHGRSVVVLEGAAVRTLLPVLLPLLDGSRTRADLGDALGGAAQPAVEQALDLLAGQGLLVDGGEATAPELAVAAAYGLGPADAANRLRAARVAIVGSSTVGAEIARLLRRAGIGSVDRLDWEPEREVAITVVSAAPAEAARLERWNTAALDRAVRWLLVRPFDGAVATVGPLVIPGESACYACLLLRLAGLVEYAPDFAAIERTPVKVQAGPPLEAILAAVAAQLVIGWVGGHDTRLPGVLHVLEAGPPLALTTHLVLKVPALPCLLDRGGPRSTDPLARGRRRVIAALSPRLRRAVSPYTGIVGAVEECLHGTADPPLFQAACDLTEGEGLLGASLGHLFSVGGVGATRSEAASAAVGEALERYSATYVPRERLVVATAREVGDDAVEPERFALFSDRQHAEPGFGFGRFTSDSRIAWVEGRALPDGRPAFLPAELVYLGPATVCGSDPIAYSTSSGLACDESDVLSTVKGAFEILERDAFMLVWSNRLSLPLLDASDDVFDRAGLGYAAVDLSPIHRIPCVLGVVRAREGTPGALGVGAAAATTVERARWKALAEAFTARTAGVKLTLLEPDADGHQIVSFDDHIRRYAEHRHAACTAFLDAGSERVPLESVPPLETDSPEELLAALCARIEAAGSSAYAVDVTAPDVAELGLTVTKVVAPELCALDTAHSARFLGGRRLYEAAFELGLASGPIGHDELNPDPHPFP